MVLVHTPRGPESWHEATLVSAVSAGQLHPETPASFDEGRTWITVGLAAARLRDRGDAGVALLVPMRTEGWSTGAGYVALFSLFFFGGPLCFAAVVVGYDVHTPPLVRLGFALVALVFGPLPPALMAWLGFRALARDPTLRGKGRAIFALVLAGLMALSCMVAAFGILFVR